MSALIEFLFILIIPLVLVGGGLVTLFAVGAIFEALENPGRRRRWVENAFRRPPKEPKVPGPDHYYKPYWQSSKTP
jgi:hypothetical protein